MGWGMAIKYAPQNGSILVCDYDGILPEMVKRRPVVVVSSVSEGLCIVVPLSTSPPVHIQPWNLKVVLSEPLPPPYIQMTCWAKCDMVQSVSFERLFLLREGKDNGKRKYISRSVGEENLAAIRSGIWRAVSASR